MNAGVDPPQTAELNLLLEWPEERSWGRWAAILGASIALHIVLFTMAVQMETLVGKPVPPVVKRHVLLYLPPELMTQRAPNRREVTKQIDLADLEASRASAQRGSRASAPRVKRFQMPKQDVPKEVARNVPPQILPEAPKVDTTTKAPAIGAVNGLPTPVAPPPPKQPDNPFQEVGGPVPKNEHPTLAPPSSAVNAMNGSAQPSRKDQPLSINDDVPQRTVPGSLGANDQAQAQHAAVELQSDPTGADFREYLRQILLIVRANWHRVLPESARMGTLKGRVVVEFVISRDGSIPKMVIADTSGSGALDRAAVAGLSMSNPLPPLPTDYRGMQVRLAFTFAYNLPSK